MYFFYKKIIILNKIKKVFFKNNNKKKLYVKYNNKYITISKYKSIISLKKKKIAGTPRQNTTQPIDIPPLRRKSKSPKKSHTTTQSIDSPLRRKSKSPKKSKKTDVLDAISKLSMREYGLNKKIDYYSPYKWKKFLIPQNTQNFEEIHSNSFIEIVNFLNSPNFITLNESQWKNVEADILITKGNSRLTNKNFIKYNNHIYAPYEKETEYDTLLLRQRENNRTGYKTEQDFFTKLYSLTKSQML